MNKTQYAKHLGVSKQYIGRLIKDGKLTPLPNGRIDEVAADKQLSRNLSPAKAKIPIPDSGTNTVREIDLDDDNISLTDARKAYEIVKTKLLQLELDLKEKKVLDADEVEKALFETGRTIRDAIQNMPARICSSLPCDEKIRFAVENQMKTEIHNILVMLSDDLKVGK